MACKRSSVRLRYSPLRHLMYLVFSYLATHQVLTLPKLCHSPPISAAWKAQKLPTQHPAYLRENPSISFQKAAPKPERKRNKAGMWSSFSITQALGKWKDSG